MARQYSPTQFFRRVPNALLARYFQEKHQALFEIDFSGLRENDAAAIHAAVLTLPVEKQIVIEAECQDIDAMACQGGVSALADKANFHGDAGFAEAIAGIGATHPN